MKYIVREGIIPRDIAGVYFLIDIHDKSYYDSKKIYTTNQIGYELCSIMMKKTDGFIITDIVDELKRLLINYSDDLYNQIISDVNKFVKELSRIGYILEIKEIDN